jgi:hypothetical protein
MTQQLILAAVAFVLAAAALPAAAQPPAEPDFAAWCNDVRRYGERRCAERRVEDVAEYEQARERAAAIRERCAAERRRAAEAMRDLECGEYFGRRLD